MSFKSPFRRLFLQPFVYLLSLLPVFVQGGFPFPLPCVKVKLVQLSLSIASIRGPLHYVTSKGATYE